MAYKFDFGAIVPHWELLVEEGMTLVMVTHEMRFAREVCDKLVFMHQGRIHETGDPETVFANPKTPELSSFVGGLA